MHIVIVGNGVAGITTARHVRKRSRARITVISSESRHFFSRPALMYVFMGHLRFDDTKPYEDFFWKKNHIDLLFDHVEEIDFAQKCCLLRSGKSIRYDKLVLATGSKPKDFGWPFSRYQGVQGLYHLQDVETLERHVQGAQHAVIVGGGLIGVELAEMLHSRKLSVTMLVMEEGYWGNMLPAEESALVTSHIRKHGIDVLTRTTLREPVADEHRRIKGIITGEGTFLSCELLGITIGVKPNIDFLRGSKLHTHNGILVNAFFETNVPDVYAVGDCAEFHAEGQSNAIIEQLWYTARKQGYFLARNLCGERIPYQPGIGYNSAKFFDLEYQLCGTVQRILPVNQASFWWQHPSEEKCLRIVYDRQNMTIVGIHTLGLRFRHETCAKWISASIPWPQSIRRLNELWFEPELSKLPTAEVQKHFEEHIRNVC